MKILSRFLMIAVGAMLFSTVARAALSCTDFQKAVDRAHAAVNKALVDVAAAFNRKEDASEKLASLKGQIAAELAKKERDQKAIDTLTGKKAAAETRAQETSKAYKDAGTILSRLQAEAGHAESVANQHNCAGNNAVQKKDPVKFCYCVCARGRFTSDRCTDVVDCNLPCHMGCDSQNKGAFVSDTCH